LLFSGLVLPARSASPRLDLHRPGLICLASTRHRPGSICFGQLGSICIAQLDLLGLHHLSPICSAVARSAQPQQGIGRSGSDLPGRHLGSPCFVTNRPSIGRLVHP
jgi:hypothetical protein